MIWAGRRVRRLLGVSHLQRCASVRCATCECGYGLARYWVRASSVRVIGRGDRYCLGGRRRSLPPRGFGAIATCDRRANKRMNTTRRSASPLRGKLSWRARYAQHVSRTSGGSALTRDPQKLVANGRRRLDAAALAEGRVLAAAEYRDRIVESRGIRRIQMRWFRWQRARAIAGEMRGSESDARVY